MQRTIRIVIIGVLLLILTPRGVLGAGTALMLGSGQEFRFDLPIDGGKEYLVSMALRTDLSDAVVTMTLCQIRNNNEVIELQSTQIGLGDSGSWHILALPEVHTLDSPGRFELIVTASEGGRYFWKDLKAERVYGTTQDSQAYWSEKLATQGTFFTGLVVDARHLDVRRGMSPRIYSESGQLLYGGVLASQNIVQEQGIVGYGSELSSDLLERLTVDSDYPYVAPLVVQALGIADAAKTGVYISDEDTRKVLEAMVQYDFFARFAVIFLVD